MNDLNMELKAGRDQGHGNVKSKRLFCGENLDQSNKGWRGQLGRSQL